MCLVLELLPGAAEPGACCSDSSNQRFACSVGAAQVLYGLARGSCRCVCVPFAPVIGCSAVCRTCHCRETSLGAAFFGSVATPRTVKNILCQAYANDAAVTDELVDAILKPGLQVRLC